MRHDGATGEQGARRRPDHVGHRRCSRRAAAVLAALAAVGSLAGIGDPSVATARPADGEHRPSAATGSGSFARPVYVTNSANVGGVANVNRFATRPDGRLTHVELSPAVHGARGMVFTRDLRFAYVAATQSSEITMYRVGPDGALDRFGSTATDQPFGIAMAPDGGNVYVANSAAGTVSAFAVDAESGRLSPRGAPVATGEETSKGVAVTPDGRFLYVSHGAPLDGQRRDLVGFALLPDGRVGPEVARVESGMSAAETVVTPDGRFVYVVHQASHDVVGYRIGDDGSLREVARHSPGEAVEAAVVSPDGRLLYVGFFGFLPPSPDSPPDPSRPGAVVGYRIGDDGSLTPVERVELVDPIALALAPDGRNLYASSYGGETVTALAVHRSGRLTVRQTLPSQGDQPAFDAVSILPNRGPVAALTAQPAAAGRATRFDASASSDADGRVRRYDWDFGDGATLVDGGPTPSHTYREPGTYQARVTVTDDEGCSTRPVYTGQLAHCLGSDAATATRSVTVRG